MMHMARRTCTKPSVLVRRMEIATSFLCCAGGFAFVYLATDERTGENVVLKRMSVAADDEATLSVAR
jgi:serine/threonine protein kinase